MEIPQPTVFISYSHDSTEHERVVLSFAERLRRDGVDAQLDQYVKGRPPETWPRWMLDKLDWADFVFLICTETYYRRFRGHGDSDTGKGVDWEGQLITGELYASKCRTKKFVPVIFAPQNEKFIPEPLRLWDLERGQTIRTFEGHTDEVRAAAVTPNDRRVVSCSKDGTLRLCDLENGKEIATLTGVSAMWTCAVASDRRTIIAGEASARVHFLQLIEASATNPYTPRSKSRRYLGSSNPLINQRRARAGAFGKGSRVGAAS